MKILIIGFWFPPANVIGAIRLGKLARYLDRHGHDVRVLTTDLGDDRSLPLEIAGERVIYTEYRERRDWLAALPRRRGSHRPGAAAEGRAPVPVRRAGAAGALREFFRRQYYGVTGRLKMLDPSVRPGLSRDGQYRKLEQFLAAVHKGPGNRRWEGDA
ncbi:MAG: hypothetical protein ACJ8AH_07465 [Stellaceae bacterium]|jgi:hypothetical protein